MRFVINMDCGNAAFDDQPEIEVARILRDIADKLENTGRPAFNGPIYDVNGNAVGRYKLA